MSDLRYLCTTILVLLPSLAFSETVNLDPVSVTATKIEKGTKEISQSISVTDAKTIEDKNVLNISEALEGIPGVQAESTSNSPNPRLIIRGAGLKARYGVREIMVIKDGIPVTDPDSFTRFDYIDMQDVERVEVQKGPGSINAVNATGGVIQLITKSVFEDDNNRIKLGIGDDGQYNANLKIRKALSVNDFASSTLTHRQIDNDWRDNNNFDSTQGSVKYGHIFEDASTLETETSYTESNIELPASMNLEEFELFKKTGEQHDTSDQWQNSARDSKIFSINTKYEKQIREWTLKPRIYYNHWEHFHPVTGLINDSDNNNVFGTDVEADSHHKLFARDADLIFGVTVKQDRTRDAKKFEYADLETETTRSGWGTSVTTVESITRTLTNNKGDLAGTEDTTTTLYGLYAMEIFSPADRFTIDISSRIDQLDFDISGDEITTYDYSSKSYKPGVGVYDTDRSYTLLSAKLGTTYALTGATNIYASVASANQAPTTSELGDNDSLDKTQSINYEVGLKSRAEKFSCDLAIYQNDITDEIIQIKDANGNSIYDNAGKTQKRGFELLGNYFITSELSIGASYAYSDFKYKSFEEKVGRSFVSRDGNYLPYIPQNQYALNASYRMANGFKSRIQTISSGSYYMDNANSKKYQGYDFVTDLMVGYDYHNHSIQLNAYNIFDKHYASEATKDVYGDEAFKAAAPGSVMLTYSYKF